MSNIEAATLLGGVHRGRVEFAGVSTDSRRDCTGELFIALRGPHSDGHEFVPAAVQSGAVCVLVDRAVDHPVPCIRVEDTRLAMLSLAEHWRDRFDPTVAAVTGSNGKTTVKEMLAAVCAVRSEVLATRGNLNNDIGVPLTLFRLAAEHRHAVIELGANHAGEIELLAKIVKPKVGVITQCAPAHLEGFGTVDDVARAKGELLEQIHADGLAVFNGDDAYAPLWERLAGKRRTLRFGLTAPSDVSATWCPRGERTRMMMMTPLGTTAVDLRLPGRHNVMNALAASAAAIGMGFDLGEIREGLEGVAPIKGRLQPVETPGRYRVLDDTYNANPTSLRAGLEVLSQYPGHTWLVMGDMAELGEAECRFHEEAGVLARELGVEKLFATGEFTRCAVEAFGEGGYHFDSQGELIAALRGGLGEDVTLLVKGSRSMQMERVVDALLEAS